MPLYKLMSEMPYEELSGWFEYFEIMPPGWQADYRAFCIMRSMGSEAKATDLFESLRKMQEGASNKNRFSGLAGLMAKAKGGDKLDVDKA